MYQTRVRLDDLCSYDVEKRFTSAWIILAASTFTIFPICSFHSLRHRIRTVEIVTVQLDVQTQFVVYNQSAELSHRL